MAEKKQSTQAAKRAKLAYAKSGVHGNGKQDEKNPGDKRTPGQKLYQIG